jgi:GDPmannose 4,6-dehydratase
MRQRDLGIREYRHTPIDRGIRGARRLTADNVTMRALICGITGQDGAYLARLLLSKGYEVWGTSRDAQTTVAANLQRLKISGQVQLVSMAPSDFRSVLTAVDRSDPDEIYYLAGQSSVGLSFEQPAETLESIVSGVLNLLEVIRLRRKAVRFYHAGSSECFGDTEGQAANELTPFRPRSPYAVAKASAHWLVTNYRESYGMHACTGILFNHESVLRPQRFVTQKIVQAAKRIGAGSDERLILGRLDIQRDWGWAPEYVEAMWKMLRTEDPMDFVIATGEAHSLQEFVAEAFGRLGLDWGRHVEISPDLFRPSEIARSLGCPQRANEHLEWSSALTMPQVVGKMLHDEV